MANLVETKVQDRALRYLSRYYEGKAKNGRLFAAPEVRTHKKYGGKRADGLLAFRRRWGGGVYLVSMEAKSYKTLLAIKPRLNVRLWLFNSLQAGLVICILSGAFFAWFKMEDEYWRVVIPLNAFVLGALAYGLLTRNHFGHRTVDMVEQLFQYPANERWIACSKDSLQKLSEQKRNNLEKICKERGVGLLLVKGNGQVDVRCEPKKNIKWWGDYLSRYAREKEIRSSLS